ncbi:hypothetical protein HY382_02735 [Candidatus Curtissbacteria bacterium]|nr:hypothetical protein [Candidatus Curtissbacteria bacterium]
MPVECEPKSIANQGEKSFANTISFLEEASAVPIDWKMQFPTKGKTQSRKQWERAWEIAGLYAGTDYTLDDIGKKYNLTRERIRQIFKAGVTKIHDQSNWHIADKHPLETLNLHKPRPVKSRKEYSESRNGLSSKIAEEIEKGASLNEIEEKLKISVSGRHRSVLSGWGVNIPYKSEAFSAEYKQELEKLRDPQTPNGQLHKIMCTVIEHGRYERYSKIPNPYVISVSKAARLASIFPHPYTSQIARMLLANNIPVVRYKYKYKDGKEIFTYMIASGKLNSARLVFKKKAFDRFRKNPVTVIGSNNGEIPATTPIKNSPDFANLSSLIKEMGLKLPQTRRGRPRLTSFIKANCPVPVFVYCSYHTFRLSDKEALKNYLLKTSQNR